MKIQAFIFSHNRASQCRLLLESINRNAPGVYDLTVTYNYSEQKYLDGYEKLMKEGFDVKWECQKGHIFFYEGDRDKISYKEYRGFLHDWVKYHNFGDFLMKLINPKVMYISYFCDDDVMFDKVDYRTIDIALTESDVAGFALRLGLNVTEDYASGEPTQLQHYDNRGGYIRWYWPKLSHDWGYPMAFSGNVYRTKDLIKLMNKIRFENVNRFEAHLNNVRKYMQRNMAAYKTSRVVNVPNNLVQKDYGNRFGDEHFISAEELNDKYLDGYVIDYDALDLDDIHSCHKELEFTMKN